MWHARNLTSTIFWERVSDHLECRTEGQRVVGRCYNDRIMIYNKISSSPDNSCKQIFARYISLRTGLLLHVIDEIRKVEFCFVGQRQQMFGGTTVVLGVSSDGWDAHHSDLFKIYNNCRMEMNQEIQWVGEQWASERTSDWASEQRANE